jgi:hypothetical protein
LYRLLLVKWMISATVIPSIRGVTVASFSRRSRASQVTFMTSWNNPFPVCQGIPRFRTRYPVDGMSIVRESIATLALDNLQDRKQFYGGA